jgi:hypothetical protein
MCIGILAADTSPAPAFAQRKGDGWAPLTQLYASERIDRPVIAPDPSGALHVLWWGLTTGQEDEAGVILYTRWDGQHWAPPTDVLVAPAGRPAYFPEAMVDLDGTLHVTWMGPQLYHSAVPSWAAMDPHAWSPPQDISEGRAVSSPSGITIDPSGTIHVVFAASFLNEVYHVSSTNGRPDWETPNLVYAAQGVSVSTSRLAVDKEGVLHSIWTLNTLPDGYPPVGVVYARSGDGGTSWSEPIELFGADIGQGEIVVSPDGTIHVVSNGRAGVEGRYHRWSKDGGMNWSAPVELMSDLVAGGLTGDPGLAVDSTNTVHYIGQQALYSEWRGQHWSPLQKLGDLAPTTLSYIEQSTLAVAMGNELHAVFWDGRKRLWHTWRFIDAPAQTPISHSTPTPALPAPETVSPLPRTPGPSTIRPTLSPAEQPEPVKARHLSRNLLVSASSSALLVGLSLLWHRHRHRV